MNKSLKTVAETNLRSAALPVIPFLSVSPKILAFQPTSVYVQSILMLPAREADCIGILIHIH